MGSDLRKRYKLTFTDKIVREPVMSRLTEECGVTYNMMRGRFSDRGGWLDVELAGSKRALDKAVKFLASQGLEVEETR